MTLTELQDTVNNATNKIKNKNQNIKKINKFSKRLLLTLEPIEKTIRTSIQVNIKDDHRKLWIIYNYKLDQDVMKPINTSNYTLSFSTSSDPYDSLFIHQSSQTKVEYTDEPNKNSTSAITSKIDRDDYMESDELIQELIKPETQQKIEKALIEEINRVYNL